MTHRQPAKPSLARPALLLGMALALAGCQQASEDQAAAAPAAAASVPGPAQASDAEAEVRASMQQFAAAQSFHAVMTLEGEHPMTTTMDFQAPDRFRMSMPMGTQTIIGNTMYMEMQGQTTQVPLAEDVQGQWRDPLKIEDSAQAITVTAQGSETIDGATARKYLVRHGPPDESEMTYWIGADNLPLQLRHTGESEGQPYTMTLRYSRFGDPTIQVDAPG